MDKNKIRELSKKVDVQLNTKPEKIIMAASISTAMAIMTIGSKKKKGIFKKKKAPNFFQRTKKYYASVDKLLTATVAKNIAANEVQRLKEEEFKTKLRDLEIEGSIPFDPQEEA